MVFEFILANLPIIICALLGVGLLVVEVFMPGFGLPGISGIALLGVSVALAWSRFGAGVGLGVTVVALALVGIAISVSLKSAASGKISKSDLILRDGESREAGFVASGDMESFLGKEGVASTVLRPAGIAEFGGVKLNVVSDGEFIGKGEPVRIERVEGVRIIVRSLKA